MGQRERHFSNLIGVRGVPAYENDLARRAGIIFEVPMLMAALWFLLNWWAESHGVLTTAKAQAYDLALWGLFVAETSLLSLLVDNTRRYLKSNWLNLVIIALGIPLILGWEVHLGALRLLRLLIVFSLLAHVGGGIRKMLARNEMGTTLIASAIVIIMAGLMMAALDPNVESPLDGIWWAWVTVSTVGYGDIVPESNFGRVLAGLVILLGLGLFSLITATFSSYLVGQRDEKRDRKQDHYYRRIADMAERLARMEEQLESLNQQRGEQKQTDVSQEPGQRRR